jgi:hypothetical protein
LLIKGLSCLSPVALTRKSSGLAHACSSLLPTCTLHADPKVHWLLLTPSFLPALEMPSPPSQACHPQVASPGGIPYLLFSPPTDTWLLCLELSHRPHINGGRRLEVQLALWSRNLLTAPSHLSYLGVNPTPQPTLPPLQILPSSTYHRPSPNSATCPLKPPSHPLICGLILSALHGPPTRSPCPIPPSAGNSEFLASICQ